MKKINHIAVLTGGTSSEREIALKSAINVVNTLKEKYRVESFDLPQDLSRFLEKYQSFDVAIPVFHGPGGEDGVIQGFLKTLNLPFIFSDVEAQAVGMNKYLTKQIIEKLGILTPEYELLTEHKKIKYTKPLVIKPEPGGSSIGVSIVHNQAELDQALKEAWQYADKILLEEYIAGEEFTVPIIEVRNKIKALPVIQIVSKNKFFDYKSKYDATLVDEICPAQIDHKLAIKLQATAIKVHQAIKARHLSRSDFIVADQKIYFLEINTIPGMTGESLLPKAIKTAKMDFLELLEAWMRSVI